MKITFLKQLSFIDKDEEFNCSDNTIFLHYIIYKNGKYKEEVRRISELHNKGIIKITN